MKAVFIMFLSLFLASISNGALIYGDPYREDSSVGRDDAWRGLFTLAFTNLVREAEATSAVFFPKYFARPQDIAAGKLLSATRFGGWRLVLLHGTNAVGGVDCAADSKTGKPLASTGFGTNHFPMVAVVKAEQLPQVQKRDYEVRVFGASVFTGLWLHSKWNDLFIPSGDGFGKFQAFTPYSERQLIKILQPYERMMQPIIQASRRQHDQNMFLYGEAMMNYEKFHGGTQSSITPEMFEEWEPLNSVAEVYTLRGISSEGQKLAYRIKITYFDKTHLAISQIAVLERNLEGAN